MRDRQALVQELARVFRDPVVATHVLEDAGYPRGRIPPMTSYTTPELYWSHILTEVESGVLAGGGPELLVDAALRVYASNTVFLVAAADVPESLPGLHIHVVDDACEPSKQGLHPDRTDGTVEDPIAAADGVQTPRRWPTAIFRGMRRPEEVLRVVRECAGPHAHLLYATAREVAALLPDHHEEGPDDEQLTARLQDAVNAFLLPGDPPIQVSFHRYPFRPQIIEQLRLVGPDHRPFIAEDVPNTTPVHRIPPAVLGQYDPLVQQDGFGQVRRAYVYRVAPAALDRTLHEQRLHADVTLAEAGVQHGDVLQVLVDDGAGSDPPPIRSRLRKLLFFPVQVFFCHASDDELEVRRVYYRLKRSGVDPWLSREDVLPGDELEPAKRKALQTADLVIVFLSQRSATNSGSFDQEIAYALEIARTKPQGRIFIIPARLEPCSIPEELRMYQWVDLFDDRGYATLLRTLGSDRIHRRRVFHEGNS